SWLYNRSNGDMNEFAGEAGSVLRHLGTKFELLVDGKDIDQDQDVLIRDISQRRIEFTHEIKNTISHLKVEISDSDETELADEQIFTKHTVAVKGKHDTSLEQGDWQM